MKNLLFGIIATVLFSTFSFGQTSLKLEDLQNSKNPHNNIGQEMYLFYNDLSNQVDNGKITNEEFKVKVEASSYATSKLSLNDLELKKYELYFKSKEISIPRLISFENTLITDLKGNEKLLKAVAYLKWGIFLNQSSETVLARNFEGCLDNCIDRKLRSIEQGNWIDQTEFVLGLPASFAYIAASCAWSCR